MPNYIKKISLGVAFFAAAALVAIPAESSARKEHPIKDGAEFLATEGYNNVTGGERDYVNGCEKGAFARKYAVTNGPYKQEKTVCFSPLYGTYKAAW